MILPTPYADTRNAMLRESGKDGANLFDVPIPNDNDQGVSSGWEEWHKIVDQFAYNVEEAADNWWQAQGKVMEANRGGVVDGPVLQIMIAQTTKEM